MKVTEKQLLEKGLGYYQKEDTLEFTIQNMSKGEVFKIAFPKEDWNWKEIRREYGAERDCGYGGFVDYMVTKKTLEDKKKESLKFHIERLEKKFNVKLKVV